jgi:hypothetical protein
VTDPNNATSTQQIVTLSVHPVHVAPAAFNLTVDNSTVANGMVFAGKSQNIIDLSTSYKINQEFSCTGMQATGYAGYNGLTVKQATIKSLPQGGELRRVDDPDKTALVVGDVVVAVNGVLQVAFYVSANFFAGSSGQRKLVTWNFTYSVTDQFTFSTGGSTPTTTFAFTTLPASPGTGLTAKYPMSEGELNLATGVVTPTTDKIMFDPANTGSMESNMATVTFPVYNGLYALSSTSQVFQKGVPIAQNITVVAEDKSGGNSPMYINITELPSKVQY